MGKISSLMLIFSVALILTFHSFSMIGYFVNCVCNFLTRISSMRLILIGMVAFGCGYVVARQLNIALRPYLILGLMMGAPTSILATFARNKSIAIRKVLADSGIKVDPDFDKIRNIIMSGECVVQADLACGYVLSQSILILFGGYYVVWMVVFLFNLMGA